MRQSQFLISLSIFLFAVLLSCGGGDGNSSMEDFSTRQVTLPDGTSVKTEVLTKPADMARGMMFRDSMPQGHAMLFIHQTPNKYPYWMYQVKVPLDIIWMDRRGKIVEFLENTPACTGKASECVNYGGSVEASVVLELPGGYGRRHGVRVGEVIRF